MPPPRKSRATAQKHELDAFAEKYDMYADIYGDPVEVVFRIMSDAADQDLKLQAANTLMGYRYPRIKAAEVADTVAPVLNFNVNMPVSKELPARTLELVRVKDD